MATASTRRTTKATPAKAAPVKAAATKPAEAAPAATDERPRTVIQLVQLDPTKRYSKWGWPDDAPAGCTGNLYAPLEVTEVRVAIFGLPE